MTYFNFASFPVLIFDELSGFLFVYYRFRCTVWTGLFFCSVSRFLRCNHHFFFDSNGRIVFNIVQNTLGTEILDSALGIDATIQHTYEIEGPRNDEFDMVRDKNLYQNIII